jgi:putative DNA primase/helicase
MTQGNGKEQLALYGPNGPYAELYQAPGIDLTDENKTLDQQITSQDNQERIQQFARLPMLAYQQQRVGAAKELGIRAPELDKLVRAARAEAEQADSELPHWKIEPWDAEVCSTKLLDDIEQLFNRYIVLPEGAGIALALWTLHAWTADAGDISPFLVLVSPTKRCGKTNTLIVLYYLTPRSELASNISPSALFRYIEDVRPTLLIDEADSFLKDNEEMRGILNSGHTKTAAHVIRNVEVNGEHKPRRFSTWAPKAIATIRSLADTLEDRSIVVQLQRKPKTAAVARLRKRDSDEFAVLRGQLSRWATDNFAKLTDPDPQISDALNDRAADNWRPLLAIADLAGGDWPARSRDAASILSGEGHESTSINVELLSDMRLAFGDMHEIRSADAVAKLIADPERPWTDWKHGKPLTQKQLAGLLKPFGIISTTVHPPVGAHGKGYKRTDFEAFWQAYLPYQNTPAAHVDASEACKRASADEMGATSDLQSVREKSPHGSKNGNLSHSHAGLHACTDRNPKSGPACVSAPSMTPAGDPWADLGIPPFLERLRPPRLGPPAISSGPDDDLGDFQ